METVKKKRSPVDERLKIAIGFTDDDLDANRDGYMSKRQRAWLSRDRKDWLNSISGVIVGVSVLSLLVLLTGFNPQDSESSRKVLMIGFFCVLAAVASLYAWLKWDRLNADLDKGSVFVVEGILSLDVHQDKDGHILSYHASIEGKHFEIKQMVYEVLIAGQPYIIYYAPNSNTILSAERLA